MCIITVAGGRVGVVKSEQNRRLPTRVAEEPNYVKPFGWNSLNEIKYLRNLLSNKNDCSGMLLIL